MSMSVQARCDKFPDRGGSRTNTIIEPKRGPLAGVPEVRMELSERGNYRSNRKRITVSLGPVSALRLATELQYQAGVECAQALTLGLRALEHHPDVAAVLSARSLASFDDAAGVAIEVGCRALCPLSTWEVAQAIETGLRALMPPPPDPDDTSMFEVEPADDKLPVPPSQPHILSRSELDQLYVAYWCCPNIDPVDTLLERRLYACLERHLLRAGLPYEKTRIDELFKHLSYASRGTAAGGTREQALAALRRFDAPEQAPAPAPRPSSVPLDESVFTLDS